MLIRLAIENFMSFKDQQVFSLVAGKHTKHSNHVLKLNGKRVLKGSFFFGELVKENLGRSDCIITSLRKRIAELAVRDFVRKIEL